MSRALEQVASIGERIGQSHAPKIDNFEQFLIEHARVPLDDGTFGPYTFEGREPLLFFVRLIDKIIRNTVHKETVEIDGVTFKPTTLRQAFAALCGGAQFGKSVLEQNFMAYVTGVLFKNAGTYIPDQLVLEQIVDSKFRPMVVDQIPWFAEMVQLGKAQNASGKTVHKKTCFQVADQRKFGFGFFCGMHRPPTTISLDVALVDERDDIALKNVGFIAARMTNSPIALQMDVGTQRIDGAGQNAVFEAGTQHVTMYTCAHCGERQNLEENFPDCIRVAIDGDPQRTDPKITAEAGHDRDAVYYTACLSCGHPIDRAKGEQIAKRPDRVKSARFSQRVSQLCIAAIRLQEIVGSWYTALSDPTGEALVAFYCDRIAIPKGGTLQPITPEILLRARNQDSNAIHSPYPMALAAGSNPRVAGFDTGPRCWLWVDEIVSSIQSEMAWAEMIASGKARERIPMLMELLGISCLFIDADGEPDLTKQLCLSINGLDSFQPPTVPKNELLKSQMYNIGAGLSWDGSRSRWTGLRAAAVDFISGEAKGIEQTIGFTVEGKIYPLIKCNRGESIQMAVNDFLTPSEGVLELIETKSDQGASIKKMRQRPRAQLPITYIGPGATQAIVDAHLKNLRKVKDPKTGEEDWADKVENHIGLAKVYARLAATVFEGMGRAATGVLNPETAITFGGHADPGGRFGGGFNLARRGAW